jgi:GTP-binding protein HflX
MQETVSIQDPKVPELKRAIAVGVLTDSRHRDELDEHLRELALLADTAGFEVVSTVVQERKAIDPATFIGSGKVAEIAALTEELSVEAVIFDDDLSPSQGRNLEEAIQKPVTDRTGLILDIFASRARTREAKTQVELARLQYLLPRLTGLWSHFTRQRGGVGMRGEGETQLEMDRRMTKTRIAELRRELEHIRRQAETRRQGRSEAYQVSLVGYTNAGKSTLMNALTQAGVLAENRLFATLDASMRTLALPSGESVILTDTVGFIRKLPPNLVASFRSTLDEITDADLVLHVVDASHPAFQDHIEATNLVLDEIGAAETPTVMVFNKIDQLDGSGGLERLRQLYPTSVAIAARDGLGLDQLLATIQTHYEAGRREVRLRLGPSQQKAISLLHQRGRVQDMTYDDDGHTLMRVLISPKDLGQIHAEVGHDLEMVPGDRP